MYPCVAFEKNKKKIDEEEEKDEEIVLEKFSSKTHRYFVSINRYEEKKNIPLAVLAFALLKEKLDPSTFKKLHLVIAGGYDERVEENKRVSEQLKHVVREKKIEDQVTFLYSISTQLKNQLIRKCVAVIYTPSDEHFGIVPIETMNMGKIRK